MTAGGRKRGAGRAPREPLFDLLAAGHRARTEAALDALADLLEGAA